MVYREELLERFWDGKEVYDQSLSKAVGSIRKALGEPQGSEFIETRWGLGYRYVGPFQELPPTSGPHHPRSRGHCSRCTLQPSLGAGGKSRAPGGC